MSPLNLGGWLAVGFVVLWFWPDVAVTVQRALLGLMSLFLLLAALLEWIEDTKAARTNRLPSDQAVLEFIQQHQPVAIRDLLKQFKCGPGPLSRILARLVGSQKVQEVNEKFIVQEESA